LKYLSHGKRGVYRFITAKAGAYTVNRTEHTLKKIDFKATAEFMFMEDNTMLHYFMNLPTETPYMMQFSG